MPVHHENYIKTTITITTITIIDGNMRGVNQLIDHVIMIVEIQYNRIIIKINKNIHHISPIS